MCECCKEYCEICLGKDTIDFLESLSNSSDKCVKNFVECVKDGWKNVQPNSRPDYSFREMLRVMIHWAAYLENKQISKERDQDMGRIQEKLQSIIHDDIFYKLSKHDPYWHSKDEQEADKLEDLRGKFSWIQDKLCDCLEILVKEEC